MGPFAAKRASMQAFAVGLVALALVRCGGSNGGAPGVSGATSDAAVDGSSPPPATPDAAPSEGSTGGGNSDAGGAVDAAGTPISSVFTVDTPNVVRRSNLILTKPNALPQQAMALGNGALGVAAWAASGFTAQLNRVDTMPNRQSIGQLTIPGLAALTGASDFQGKVDLYDGMLEESGGGMTATVFVRGDAQELVIDVTGADPTSSQTATLKLWSPRAPTGTATGNIATLAETWVDNSGLGASGDTFGSLGAVTASGQNVVASVVDSLTVQVAFKPNADGSFRVIVGAPTWAGGDAMSTATMLLGSDVTTPLATLSAGHLSFWHDYWASVGLIEMDSADGGADYVEALRTLYLFYAASERGTTYPGSQAGLADLFDYLQDQQPWFPAAWWVWNLRMQIAANMGAGAFDLNLPAYSLYTSDVAAMEAWTSSNMGIDAGICLPETMRFNGNGYWYGGVNDSSCDRAASPDYNALTLTSGSEVSLWIWHQYLMTQDQSFLSTNYPVMHAAAEFLLAAATTGSDGLLHTMANAHETQWNVQDPTTDIVAMQALFPAVISAAGILSADAPLVAQLKDALTKIPPLPRTDAQTHKQLLTAADDDAGTDVFAISYQPSADQHNAENLDLEAVWPYDLIGDEGTYSDLAKRTYTHRMFVNAGDWTFDAVDAARLGLGDEVSADLSRSITSYQSFVNGLALLGGGANNGTSEPYVEELGIVALAINEAAVQGYDGLIRVGPGWPSGWSGEGSIFIEGGSKVDFQITQGQVKVAFVEAGSTGTLSVRNPWAGSPARVIEGNTGAVVLPATSSSPLSFAAQTGRWYAVVPGSSGSIPVVAVTGSPATAPKTFGSSQLGL